MNNESFEEFKQRIWCAHMDDDELAFSAWEANRQLAQAQERIEILEAYSVETLPAGASIWHYLDSGGWRCDLGGIKPERDAPTPAEAIAKALEAEHAANENDKEDGRMNEVTWNWPRCPRCDATMAADQPKYGFYEYNCSSTIDFDNRLTVSYHCLKRQLDQRDKRIAELVEIIEAMYDCGTRTGVEELYAEYQKGVEG